ncbi:MAG: VOC family protein [Armatimonadetes bacterium]|nr:VOC family protein [Armatimonadota bacterium]
MHNICHIEFECTDLVRSQGFFQSIFDWTFRAFTEGMVVFGSGENHIGGLTKVAQVSPGKSPSVWFDVEDIDATLEKAKKAGSKVVSEKSEVPTVGFSATFTDLDGNQVGVVQFVR